MLTSIHSPLQFICEESVEAQFIVLSDIRMPGMNGYEFIRKIKESNREVKIMLMSAFEIQEKEFHNILLDINVDAFLQKPFHIQQLNDVIQKISRD